MASRASKRVIYAALLGNLLVASTKFVASGLTGSSAMASEAIHSLVDTGNELHPLGHGRELYFWSFIVALLIFTLGAGVSLYQGVRHILAPVPMSHPIV